MEADQYVPAYNYTCKMLKLYIPKQCFPGLLRTILEKDFGPSIRSGFESTGLYPLNMERALAKLPHDVAPDGDVMSAVQQHLINRLASLRYNPPPTKPALRPKKKRQAARRRDLHLPCGEQEHSYGVGGRLPLHQLHGQDRGPAQVAEASGCPEHSQADVLFACPQRSVHQHRPAGTQS
jgi:hypothetical protein